MGRGESLKDTVYYNTTYIFRLKRNRSNRRHEKMLLVAAVWSCIQVPEGTLKTSFILGDGTQGSW